MKSSSFLHEGVILDAASFGRASFCSSFQFFLQVDFSEFLLKELLAALAFGLSLLARCAAYQSAPNDMEIQKL